MDAKAVQAGLANVIIGAGVIFLMLFEKNLTNFVDIILWLTTCTFIVHWYWGLIAFIKFTGLTESFGEFFFDVVTVGVVVSTTLWITTPFVWYLLNGLASVSAIIKYVLAIKTRKLPKNIVSYILDKMKIHVLGIVGMFSGAAAVSYFQDIWWIVTATLIGNCLVIAFLIYKKVYDLH